MHTIMKKVDIHLEEKAKSRAFFVFIWLLYSTVYMTRNCFGSAMAEIVSEGVLTKTQAGIITSAFYVAYAPMQIVISMIADRVSPEKLIRVGLIGSAAINAVIFFNHNYYIMLIAWVLNAAIQAPIWPAVFKIISSQLVRSDRKQMVFYISLATSFGLVMGYIMAAFVTQWQYIFLLSAIILVLYCLGLQIFCVKLDPYMQPDKKEEQSKVMIENGRNISTVKLFVLSGLFLILPGVLIRVSVEQGTKTLSPIMLMEMYTGISASVGNLLNTFIIVSGIIGTILIKFVLYPRFIKNEATGLLIMFLIALPCAIILSMVGTIPMYGVVVALCGVSTALTATRLLLYHYNLYFVPYQKNGMVASIVNVAESLGLMAANYGFMNIAEKSGWGSVTAVWVIMIGIAAVITAVAIPLLKKFKRKGLEEWNM